MFYRIKARRSYYKFQIISHNEFSKCSYSIHRSLRMLFTTGQTPKPKMKVRFYTLGIKKNRESFSKSTLRLWAMKAASKCLHNRWHTWRHFDASLPKTAKTVETEGTATPHPFVHDEPAWQPKTDSPRIGKNCIVSHCKLEFNACGSFHAEKGHFLRVFNKIRTWLKKSI